MIRVERISGHAVLPRYLGPESIVLDLGANRGRFALGAIERFGCRVFAIEPVEALFQGLPSNPHLHAERIALAAGSGSATVFLGASEETATVQPELSDGSASEVVPALTLADLLDHFGIERASLAKMDVEGAELDVLESTPAETLGRIDQLSVEFHDFLHPEWRSRVLAVDRRLIAGGFYRLRVSRDQSDVLYVNAAHLPLTRLEKLWLLLGYRWAWGAARVARRRVGRRSY